MSEAVDDYIAPDVGIPGPSRMNREAPKVDPPVTPTKDLELQTNLVKRLEALNVNVSENGQLGKLLADPDIRALMEAKAKGINVSVVAQQKAIPTAPAEPENLEAMTNSQLAKYLNDQTKYTVETGLSNIVDAKLDAFMQKIAPTLQNVSADISNRQQRDIQEQFKSAEAKYSDWKEMLPSMMEVNKTIQGADPEELYFIAKKRAGLPLIPQKKIETERGQNPGNRRRFEVPEKITGKAGFDALARASMESRDQTSYDNE